ncbi:hypothetical protein M569_10154, partial [Genlisea aurea]
RRKLLLFFLVALAVIAILPPVYFHFRLPRFQQVRSKNCRWMKSPPLVCAHGGDTTVAFPNTMEAYRDALDSHVDCIEIDVSRSADGVLFALHDRDLQRISGNATSKVGHLSRKEVRLVVYNHQLELFGDINVPTAEDAIKFLSGSVKQVILDAKVGPPHYEGGLAKDILSVVRKTKCKNCVIWAKSDSLVQDLIQFGTDTTV